MYNIISILIKFIMDTENWMADINENTRLIDIAIPGTHDSLTYFCQSIDDYSPFTRAQNLDIGQQLYAGIRFLDMRFDYNCDWLGNDCDVVPIHGTVHCGRSVTSVQKIISTVSDWVQKHPSEILIIAMRCEGATAKRVCRDAIIQYLGNYLLRADSGLNATNTLKEIRSKGRIMVIPDDNEFQMDGVGKEFFAQDNLWSPWKEIDATSVNDVTDFLVKNYSKVSPPNAYALTCMQAIGLWTISDLFHYNIESNARNLNQGLMANIHNGIITPPQSRGKFNIIMCDYFQYGYFNKFIITLNKPIATRDLYNTFLGYENGSKNHSRTLIIIGIILCIIVILASLFFIYTRRH